MTGAPKWPAEQEHSLRELVKFKLTGYQIVDRMRQMGYTVTRHSVIGKCCRLGLALPFAKHKKSKPITPSLMFKKPSQKSYDPIPPKKWKDPANFFGLGKRTLLQLKSCECAWPLTMDFCGDPTLENSPYCAAHHAKAHAKPELKSDEVLPCPNYTPKVKIYTPRGNLQRPLGHNSQRVSEALELA